MNLSDDETRLDTFGNYTAIVRPPKSKWKFIENHQNCSIFSWLANLISPAHPYWEICLPIGSRNRRSTLLAKQQQNTIDSVLVHGSWILNVKSGRLEADWKRQGRFVQTFYVDVVPRKIPKKPKQRTYRSPNPNRWYAWGNFFLPLFFSVRLRTSHGNQTNETTRDAKG